MKSLKQIRSATILAIAAFGALATGCGSSNGNRAGQVGTGVGLPGVPGGCIPIAQQIGFTGTNIRFDWANIVGGAVPGSTPVGQMVVTGGGAGGPYQRTGVDGTISMNVQQLQMPTQTGYPTTYPGSYPYTGYPTTGTQSQTANVQGFVQISPQTQSDIMFQVQSGRIPIPNIGATVPTMPQPGYPTGYPTGYPNTGYPYSPYQQTNVCVSGIAMNVGHYYNTIYGGNVYLYLNGSQHGYVLYF